MAVFMSYDEGKTWPVKKVIQHGPCGCGYSDLAVLPDGTILCAYGSGPHFGKGAGIALARFNLSWVTDQADSLIRKVSPTR
jgi:sialidase-1